MNIADYLAKTLKLLRQERGWSLSRLAEETGLDVRKPSDAPTLYLAMLFYRDAEDLAGSL